MTESGRDGDQVAAAARAGAAGDVERAGPLEHVEQFQEVMLLHRHAEAGPVEALENEDPVGR